MNSPSVGSDEAPIYLQFGCLLTQRLSLANTVRLKRVFLEVLIQIKKKRFKLFQPEYKNTHL